MSEKLQKVLARLGLGSRRQIETWISAGRITVNGKLAKLGDRVTAQDQISIDGKAVKNSPYTQQETRILLYYKPTGEICSRHDPEGRPTVFDHLPKLRNGRWIAVGRLDFNTAGLLLFTNDGELANKLMHPSSNIDREYAVRTFGKVDEQVLVRLQNGVRLADGPAKFLVITDAGGEGSNHWYHVVINEGRNRLVRRLWESQKITVSRLIRIRFGQLTLPRDLRPGKTIELSETEIKQLFS